MNELQTNEFGNATSMLNQKKRPPKNAIVACHMAFGSLAPNDRKMNLFDPLEHYPSNQCTHLYLSFSYYLLGFYHFTRENGPPAMNETLDYIQYIDKAKELRSKLRNAGEDPPLLIFSIGMLAIRDDHIMRANNNEWHRVIGNDTLRHRLLQNLIAFALQLDLDGIDFAWTTFSTGWQNIDRFSLLRLFLDSLNEHAQNVLPNSTKSLSFTMTLQADFFMKLIENNAFAQKSLPFSHITLVNNDFYNMDSDR